MGASAGAMGGGQAPKRLPTAVGAVFGNGISSRVRQEVICELQEFGALGAGAEMACKVKIIPKGCT